MLKQIAKIMEEIKDRFVAGLALQRQLNLLEKVTIIANNSVWGHGHLGGLWLFGRRAADRKYFLSKRMERNEFLARQNRTFLVP